MNTGGTLGGVRKLSNHELLAGLQGALGSSRRLLALVVAHLGEVEERRLHLHAGFGSMFAYCTARLGMSEDEAYRRIEVARLARRFPVLFERLADGRLSLSVAALLKAHLSEENHEALIAAVSSTTVARAREVLAVWFPRADVPSAIRKLPEPRAGQRQLGFAGAHGDTPSSRADAIAAATLIHRVSGGAVDPATARPVDASRSAPAQGSSPRSVAMAPSVSEGLAPLAPERVAPSTPVPLSPVVLAPAAHVPAERGAAALGNALPRSAVVPTHVSAVRVAAARVAPRNIEPLSRERYKVQFTAGAALKQKLELARDLLRHTVPDGDFAAIVGRALDLLIEKMMQRRFGATQQSAPAAARVAAVVSTGPAPIMPGPIDPNRPTAATKRDQPAENAAPAVASAQEACGAAHAHPSRHVPNAVRRHLLARDGTRCTWRGPDGTRCNSGAWLEHDHIVPHGQGGSNQSFNIRILCRLHNRLAAELAYGRRAIARSIERSRLAQRPCRPAPQSPLAPR